MKKLDEEQLEAVRGLNDRIFFEDGFEIYLKEKGLIKEEFEVGKWYKIKNNPNNIFVYGEGYGIWNGEWRDDLLTGFRTNYCVKLTQKEVEDALRKEGDKYIGKTVRCLCDGMEFIVDSFQHYDKDGIWYKTKNFFNGNILLMKDGKWATIIEDNPIEDMTKILNDAIDKLNKLKTK